MSILFISHASQDRKAAARLRDELDRRGFSALFLDFDEGRGIGAGQDWERSLYDHLRIASRVVVLWTEHAARSKWVFAEVAIARCLGKQIMTLRLQASSSTGDLPQILSSTQAVSVDPGALDFSRIIDELHEQGMRPRAGKPRTARPFPGLEAFSEEDAGFFFGRDADVEECIEISRKVRTTGRCGLLVLMGPSGCGKSSLLRAGITPRLRWEREFLVVEPFRPGDQPFYRLALAVENTLDALDGAKRRGDDWRERSVRMRELAGSGTDASNVEWLTELRAAAGKPEATVVLLVDQLEELLGSDAAAADFLRMLCGLADRAQNHDALVLGTLSDDLLPTFQSMIDRLRSSAAIRPEIIPVFGLSAEGLRDCIVNPARLAGGRFEEELVNDLVRDADVKSGLPLVAFALERLWTSREMTTGLVSRSAYSKGKLAALLAEAADGVYAQVRGTPAERALQRALLAMVRIVDGRFTRTAIREDQHRQASFELQLLAMARLLVVRSEDNERVFELAHDVLIEAWQPLKRWLDESLAFLQWRARLERLIDYALTERKAASEVLNGRALDEALEWIEKNDDLLLPFQSEFIRAAQSATRARRRRRTGVVVAVFMAMAATTMVVWGLYAKAERSRQAAQEARRAADASRMKAETSARSAARARLAAEGTVWEARTQHLVSTQTTLIDLEGRARSVLADESYVWVLLEQPGKTVARFKADNLREIEYFDTGRADDALTAYGALWLLDRTGKRLVMVSADGRSRAVPLPARPSAIVAADGKVLVSYETRDEQETLGMLFDSFDPRQLAFEGRRPGASAINPAATLAEVSESDPISFSMLEQAAGYLWAAGPLRGDVIRIGKQGEWSSIVIASDPGSRDLAFDGQQLWLAHGGSELTRIDPRTKAVVAHDMDAPVESVYWDGRTLWAYSPKGGRLIGYDAGSRGLEAPRVLTVPTSTVKAPTVERSGDKVAVSVFSADEGGQNPFVQDRRRRLASDGTFLYVVNAERRLYRLPLLSFAVGKQPSAMIATRNHLWVASAERGEIRRYGYDGRFAGVFSASAPRALTEGRGSLWVAEAGGRIVQLDLSTGERVHEYRAHGRPSALVVAGDQIWVARGGRPSVEVLTINGAPAAGVVKPDSVSLTGDSVAALAFDGSRIWALVKRSKSTGLVAIDAESRAVVTDAEFKVNSESPPAAKAHLATSAKSKLAAAVSVTQTPPGGARDANMDTLAFDPRSQILWAVIGGGHVVGMRTTSKPEVAAKSSALAVPISFGGDDPLDAQPLGRSLWISDARANAITPLALSRGRELSPEAPVLFPTNASFRVEGGVVGVQALTQLAAARGDLWALNSGSESVMRVIVSAYGDAVVARGGCVPKPGERWVLPWDGSKKQTVLDLKLEKQIDVTQGGGLPLMLEYDGTEQEQLVTVAVKDTSGGRAELRVSAPSCEPVQARLSAQALGPRADTKRIVGLEFLVQGIARDERGLLRIYAPEGP